MPMGTIRTEWIAAGLTDVGGGRSSNEDAFLVDNERGLFIVADGMGGHNAGAVAAHASVAGLPLLLDANLSGPRSPSRPLTRVLRDAVMRLSASVRAEGERDEKLRGMGSTLACLLIRQRVAYVAHMGDSRVYLWRNGLKCLTQDHSLTALLVRERAISARSAARHPARGQLTRFIGMKQDVFPDVCRLPTAIGDRFLLCTDGLWNALSDTQIEAMMGQEEDPRLLCTTLVQAAKSQGATDNITCVVVVRRSRRNPGSSVKLAREEVE